MIPVIHQAGRLIDRGADFHGSSDCRGESADQGVAERIHTRLALRR